MSNEELAILYQQGDWDALLTLWVQVERLAVLMVRPYVGMTYRNLAADRDDLMQSAFLGMECAARAYRSCSGGFSTLMAVYVKKEAAQLLGLRGRVRRKVYEAVSADAPIGEGETLTILEGLEDERITSVEAGLLCEDTMREVSAAINRLTPKESAVARGHLLEGMSLEVVANETGITLE